MFNVEVRTPYFFIAMVKPAMLEGRKNFDAWKVEAKAYLATKGHWKCFDGTETDADKNFLAIQALNLLLHSSLFSYTEDCTSAKAAWDSISKAFEDNGIGRSGFAAAIGCSEAV